MASKRLRSSDWSPVQTRIYTRNAKEPRDERPKLPRSPPRRRPKPIHIVPGDPCPTLKAPSSSQTETGNASESLRDPEVVDLAAPNKWPRRGTPLQQKQYQKRYASPSMISQKSARQSEISFGILEYYLDRSPLQSPDLPPPQSQAPRIDTPVIDPAMEQFDFQLTTPKSTSRERMQDTRPVRAGRDTQAGAQREQPIISSFPPEPKSARPSTDQDGYKLFPTIKNTTPPSRVTASIELQPSPLSPSPNSTIFASHQQPDASYRPRKESMSSSVRSRKDSFTSFCGTRRIPMKVFSSSTASTATTKPRSSGSISTSTTSTPQQNQHRHQHPCHGSRWSGDTITSPLTVTTPGPRTSFGSLIGGSFDGRRESVTGTAAAGAMYPACFFEDDDEDEDDESVPLRRKFGWMRRRGGGEEVKLTREQRALKRGRFDERSFGSRVMRVVLCGGCCG